MIITDILNILDYGLYTVPMRIYPVYFSLYYYFVYYPVILFENTFFEDQRVLLTQTIRGKSPRTERSNLCFSPFDQYLERKSTRQIDFAYQIKENDALSPWLDILIRQESKENYVSKYGIYEYSMFLTLNDQNRLIQQLEVANNPSSSSTSSSSSREIGRPSPTDLVHYQNLYVVGLSLFCYGSTNFLMEHFFGVDLNDYVWMAFRPLTWTLHKASSKIYNETVGKVFTAGPTVDSINLSRATF